MSFRATFRDGPLGTPVSDRNIMSPRVPRRLWFAQAPEAGTPDGWMLVGTDGAEPDPTFAGQVAYVLAPELGTVDPDVMPATGENHGVAVYRLDS